MKFFKLKKKLEIEKNNEFVSNSEFFIEKINNKNSRAQSACF